MIPLYTAEQACVLMTLMLCLTAVAIETMRNLAKVMIK